MKCERKYVWLVRHGKSAWPAGVADMDRPLSQRGRRDGATMAQVLAKSENIPQMFFTSDSQRTRQTTELLNEALRVPVASTHTLYSASNLEVEKLLQQIDESLCCVAVVSHLPTVESCIRATGDWPEEHALPTLATVCYELTGRWEGITFAHAKLQQFNIPRMFRDDAT